MIDERDAAAHHLFLYTNSANYTNYTNWFHHILSSCKERSLLLNQALIRVIRAIREIRVQKKRACAVAQALSLR